MSSALAFMELAQEGQIAIRRSVPLDPGVSSLHWRYAQTLLCRNSVAKRIVANAWHLESDHPLALSHRANGREREN